MVSSVNFTREIRNAMSWPKPGRPNGRVGTNGSRSHLDGDGGDEQTPLIGRGSSPRLPAWRRFLFDCQRTPGDDSPKFFVKAAANTWHVTKCSLLSSPVNILIFFVPVGLIAGIFNWSPVWVFTLNFLGIIPMAAILSFATEEISIHLGETLGGLINATFGNAVELIVSVIALRQNQIEVVQASMLGSILSNLLLVMGMCFLLGGWFNMYDETTGLGKEQEFASGTAQTTCSLMTLAAAALILPATLYGILSDTKNGSKDDRDASILTLSRGTSIILLVLYCMYLWFQLRTHKNLFSVASSPPSSVVAVADPIEEAETQDGVAKDDDDEEELHMEWWAAALVLVAVTVIISFLADYLVEAIEPIVETGYLSRSFIGLILIPIVGNAAEHVTACVVAVRDKMDLAMGVAIGSSIQISLLVTPALVISGWLFLDRDMTLRFDTFQTVAFGLSVLVVTYTVQDGKSNYLEGAMLLGLYIIIALAFYASPI